MLMPKWLFFLVLGLAAILILLVLKRLRRAGDGRGGRAMRLTPRARWWPVCALILLANAVALTGVYLNRSGEPEPAGLSQRELGVPWDWRGSKENSGLALGLNWRVGTAESSGDYYGGYGYSGGTPDWLDEARMRRSASIPRAGQTTRARAAASSASCREMCCWCWNWPARPGSGAGMGAGERRAARGGAAGQRRQQGISPQGQAFAQEQLEREEVLGSRLFAIDVGLDRVACARSTRIAAAS
jgi:hypothetical protein